MKILKILFMLLLSFPVYAETMTYVCKYPSYSNEKGLHKSESDFILTFIVDTENRKSYILGNQGSEEVTPIPHAMGGIAFIEVTATGNVMSTAIDTVGNSVHSRNTSIGGEITPSQYYGKCELK